MIDEARIKKNLKEFAFPRLSGTGFELKAFNKVKQKVENLNLDFEIQRFTFSSFYSRIYPKIAFLSVSLIVLLIYLNFYMILSLFLILTLLSILIASVILTRKPERIQFIARLNSQNLLVKIKSLSNEMKSNDRIVIFMSHLDSKGQRFKVRTRIRIIKLWISSSIILAVIIILRNSVFIGFKTLFYIIGLPPLILNIFASIIMLLNITDNRSTGAVDNASGIACNLELVNYYAIPENRLTNYNLWFLFTGAEECGTMGIRHFYNNIENFDPNKSVIFNFESIANHVYLFPGGEEGDHAKDVDYLLLNNNRNLKINHFITKRVFGTHSDGGFLGDRGLQGYGIGEVEAYDYMHTPNDTIDKVNTAILKKLCLVLTDALKEHDSNFIK
ncbi:MAG: M28 family peptidase [Candidatus Lokiarchaeota archaeon]|nr:M28 family peptidase [Candidatus Lokiarchaeota archaeon]